eukprot:767294-Hanusia_phi.AAC.2
MATFCPPLTAALAFLQIFRLLESQLCLQRVGKCSSFPYAAGCLPTSVSLVELAESARQQRSARYLFLLRCHLPQSLHTTLWSLRLYSDCHGSLVGGR